MEKRKWNLILCLDFSSQTICFCQVAIPRYLFAVPHSKGISHSLGQFRLSYNSLREKRTAGKRQGKLILSFLFYPKKKDISQIPSHQLGGIYNDRSVSQSVSSVAQSCPTICNPMNRSTPGLPVHHQVLEFTQTHVHRVSDAIQPFHPLSYPSPPAPNPSQHRVFSNESILRMR